MAELFVGTNGLSLWTSDDSGETLSRMSTGAGIYSGSQIWALSVHPDAPRTVLIGTNTGLYELDRSTRKCRHLASPMDNMLVTCLAQSPEDPKVIFAGAQPGALFKSTDGGQHWRKLETGIQPYVAAEFPGSDMHAADPSGVVVRHWTRVTSIMIDPLDTRTLVAGVEIDGAWRSIDGGERWEKASHGLVTQDIHAFCLVRPQDSRHSVLFATTNKGLHVSDDMGRTWRFQKIASPWQYTRSIVARTDNRGVMFMTNGDGAPGSTGRLYRSENYGADWKQVPLPSEVDSSVYFLAAHPADPALIFAATNLGQIFRSRDGGDTWTQLKRRLGEIRTLMWLPD